MTVNRKIYLLFYQIDCWCFIDICKTARFAKSNTFAKVVRFAVKNINQQISMQLPAIDALRDFLSLFKPELVLRFTDSHAMRCASNRIWANVFQHLLRFESIDHDNMGAKHNFQLFA